MCVSCASGQTLCLNARGEIDPFRRTFTPSVRLLHGATCLHHVLPEAQWAVFPCMAGKVGISYTIDLVAWSSVVISERRLSYSLTVWLAL